MAIRKFDKQFKNSVVKLILDEGYSVKEISQEPGIHAIVFSVGVKRLKNMEIILFFS